MRYPADHKERTREQILSTAAKLIRKDGIVATGVVGLMKEAGLTQGGFYAHFESKEALIREAVVTAALRIVQGFERVAEAAGSDRAGLEAVIDKYLSIQHLQLQGGGCVMATVGAEISREPGQTREAVLDAARAMGEVIERRLPAGTSQPARLARSVFALMVGSMQMARLATDPEEAAEILSEGRQAARALCKIAGRGA